MKSKKRGQRGLGRGLEALLASSAESNNPMIGGSAEAPSTGTIAGGLPIPDAIKPNATPDSAKPDSLTSEAELATTAIHQERLEILAEANTLLDLLDTFEKLVRREGLANGQVAD